MLPPAGAAASRAASPGAPGSALYRRVWRWHFYAGLVCLPFLALMAITGALYLFKDPIESLVYASLRFVEPTPAPLLDAETLVVKARTAEPGEALRFVAPAEARHSAEVGINTAHGLVSVYLDPSDGRVLGRLRDDQKLMEVVKRVHSLTIVGTVANYWIEIVAGWAIVLVVSGIFLWWPRGRRGGVFSLRGQPGERMWWRDLHAVVGVIGAAAILFLAVTGMPWSAFWGQQFGRLTNELGIGLPEHLWGKPQASVPLASLGDVPWTLAQASLPQSGHHGSDRAASSPTPTGSGPVESIGLNAALRIFTGLGLPAGTPISLPVGPRGVFTAMSFPDDARAKRVVHLDRYSGAVLADVGYADFGFAGRLTEWGISLHTGRQFGWINQLVMLAGCVVIVTLAVTATTMWWKRRPRGRLGAPSRESGESGESRERAARGAVAIAVVLGLIYPLLGVSMLVALLVDAALPQRWHERFGL